MPDRETAITHLQIIRTWAKFAREHDLQFFTAKHLEDIAQWSDDALALLKEQEDLGTELTNAVELIHKKTERIEKLLKEQKAVVRCKDCKHGRLYEPNAVDCEYRELATEPDWFCADGEAKE